MAVPDRKKKPRQDRQKSRTEKELQGLRPMCCDKVLRPIKCPHPLGDSRASLYEDRYFCPACGKKWHIWADLEWGAPEWLVDLKKWAEVIHGPKSGFDFEAEVRSFRRIMGTGGDIERLGQDWSGLDKE